VNPFQQQRRWINHALPQTLQIAVFLLYIRAAFDVLSLIGALGSAGNLSRDETQRLFQHQLGSAELGLLLAAVYIASQILAGWGIANERKRGWQIGVVVAFIPALTRVLVVGAGALIDTNVLSLMFEVALIALVLHPMSQEHQRVWFH